jgi:phage shock protein PspC (stress-responsive transcriptional regulator)
MEQNSSGGFDRGQLKDVHSWRRSRSDRMLAGVCGGIGRALNVDPVLVRVVMAVLVITGPGLFFYVAAWVLMPDEGSDRSAAQGLLGDRVRPDHPWLWPVVVGVCIFVAIAMMSSFHFGRAIPGPLVVLGLLWLFVFRRKGRTPQWANRANWSRSVPADSSGTPTAQYQSNPPYEGAQPQSTQYQTAPAAQRPQDRVTEPVQPVWTEDDPLGLYVDEPPTTTTATRTTPEPPVKGRRGVKPAIVGLTAVAILIAWSTGTSTALMLTIGLGTLGLGMLFGGFLGKTLGLLPLGILLALGIAATTIFPNVPRHFEDKNIVAEVTTTVTSTSNVYQFDAGSVHLDLTKATFAPGAKVVVNGGVGEVVVKVPQNLDVTGDVVAKTGEVVVFGQKKGGHTADLTVNDLGADQKTGPQSVELDLDLKLGSIRVERG